MSQTTEYSKRMWAQAAADARTELKNIEDEVQSDKDRLKRSKSRLGRIQVALKTFTEFELDGTPWPGGDEDGGEE